jgi:hypothetical protein
MKLTRRLSIDPLSLRALSYGSLAALLSSHRSWWRTASLNTNTNQLSLNTLTTCLSCPRTPA